MDVSLDDGCLTNTNITNDQHLVQKLAMFLNVTGVLLQQKAEFHRSLGSCKYHDDGAYISQEGKIIPYNRRSHLD
jgi:hypothetical protein